MDKKGFTGCGNWYKGNLHSHSVHSDGALTPKQMAKFFRKRGYSFLCISDHDFYTDYRLELNKNDFIILPGYEASAVLYEDYTFKRRLKVHHMNAILGTSKMQEEASIMRPDHKTHMSTRRSFGDWDGASIARGMAKELIGMGFIVMYNHPVWSRVTEDEFTKTEGIFGLEIFNYNTENESGTGHDTRTWDSMLRDGKKIWGVATDDNHNEGKFDDAFGGFIMVQAPFLSHDNIIENMLAGNYYSSSGPEIFDWGVCDDMVYVKCSKVAKVNFIAGNGVSDGASVLSGSVKEKIESAEYKLNGYETYVRVECIDRYGRTAWTNPIFLK